MRRLAAALALVALAHAAPARASTTLGRSVEALAADADAVVRATVVSTSARWTGDGRRIVTDVRLSVLETLAGATGAQLVVTVPGGAVGDYAQDVSGGAKFTAGEQVVVFLRRVTSGERWGVLDLADGKFTVSETTARRQTLGLERRSRVAPLDDTLDLATLRERVRRGRERKK